MIITRLKLTNWRNFAAADVPLRDRAFVIGPNASGKSNLLDAVRFLRDVAKREGGGLQAAVARRGGVAKIRCLSARANSVIAIETHLSQDADAPAEWVYRLAFSVETSGSRRVLAREETIKRGDETILSRPDQDDESDSERLTATALEQINVNRPFREAADFFGSVSYLHLVPQLVRHGAEIGGSRLENDPFGQGFPDEIAGVDEKYPRKPDEKDRGRSRKRRPASGQTRFRARPADGKAASEGSLRQLEKTWVLDGRNRAVGRNVADDRAFLGAARKRRLASARRAGDFIESRHRPAPSVANPSPEPACPQAARRTAANRAASSHPHYAQRRPALRSWNRRKGGSVHHAGQGRRAHNAYGGRPRNA